MTEKINLIFAGTPKIAVPLLRALSQDERFDVNMVITQQDRPAGRKMELTAPPVKEAAREISLPLFQPESINSAESLNVIKEIAPDIIAVMAYGQIFKPEILAVPKYGCLNVHASILPKYRGASPVQSAIMEKEEETGISLMKMEEEMDRGPVYRKFPVEIKPDENSITLAQKLAELSAEKIPDALYQIAYEGLVAIPQNEEDATYCQKIRKTDGLINWDEKADSIYAKIRAFSGWPSSYTWFNGKRMKILEAEINNTQKNQEKGSVFKEGEIIGIIADNGSIIPKKLQLEGKNPQNINEFIIGNPDFINTKLTDKP